MTEVQCYTNRCIFFQPTARPPGNDFSYRRMDGGPHMNGGVPQEDSVPMHLTNGYADNMLTNVCPHIKISVMHVNYFQLYLLIHSVLIWIQHTTHAFVWDSCFVCHNNALQEIKYYWLWVIKVNMLRKMYIQTLYLMP